MSSCQPYVAYQYFYTLCCLFLWMLTPEEFKWFLVSPFFLWVYSSFGGKKNCDPQQPSNHESLSENPQSQHWHRWGWRGRVSLKKPSNNYLFCQISVFLCFFCLLLCNYSVIISWKETSFCSLEERKRKKKKSGLRWAFFTIAKKLWQRNNLTQAFEKPVNPPVFILMDGV